HRMPCPDHGRCGSLGRPQRVVWHPLTGRGAVSDRALAPYPRDPGSRRISLINYWWCSTGSLTRGRAGVCGQAAVTLAGDTEATGPGGAAVRVGFLGGVVIDQPQVPPGRGRVEVDLVEWPAGAVREVLPAQGLALFGGVRVSVTDRLVELDRLAPAVEIVIADPPPARVPMEWAAHAR